jgi:RND family efflux transporter MFP subunit
MRKVIFAVTILVVVVLAFIAGNRYGKDQIDSSGARSDRQVLFYVDPMTPGFRSETPGIAPCGMPLEPVYAETGDDWETGAAGGASHSQGAVKVSSVRQQLIGVKVLPVALEPMTYTLRLYGKIVPDETNIYIVNTSTDSWVQKLSDITTGSIVSKDQVLAEVLDPDFYTAQVTYLVSLSNLERYKDKLGGDVRLRQIDLADNQMRVAIQDIQDLGITDAQIEELAKTRKAQPLLQVRSPIDGVVLNRNLSLHQWVKAGEEFYRIADIGKVWVYADVYEDEAIYLRPGMDVRIIHPQTGRNFDAKVSQVLPLFDPLAKTLKVRIDVDNPRYDLRPDMFVDVEIPIIMPPSLHVSADAVIDSGKMKVVYVDIGNSTFEPRRVETGWRLGRQIEITGGLMPGEKVIVSGNFLIDSESRMKIAATGIHGPRSRDPVCGMDVEEETAEMYGRKATYADETYYFCRVQCKESFEKDPEKYARKVETGGKGENHAAIMRVNDQSWLDMLKQGRIGQDPGDDGIVPDALDTEPEDEPKPSITAPSPAFKEEYQEMEDAVPVLSVSDKQEQPPSQ